MDKLPVTPSPHRFLALKNKKTSRNKAEAHQFGLQQPAHQPSVPKNPNEASRKVPAPLGFVQTPTEPHLISPSNITVADHSTSAENNQGAKFGGYGIRAKDSESLAAGYENADTGPREGADRRADGPRALNAVATPGGNDSLWQGGESPATGSGERTEMPTAKQVQTPRPTQFKAAPRFRFASSQAKTHNTSPLGVTASNNAGAHITQPIWRATQTPLRQSLRRGVTEEEIVDGDGGEMLLGDGRESIERDAGVNVNMEREEHEDVTTLQLDAEAPMVKRRKVYGDSVQSLSHSQSEHHGVPSYEQSQADADSFPQAHRFERNDGDQNDEEMLYNNDDEGYERQEPSQDLSHSILALNHQKLTPALTHSQRPRFILPTTSHLARPSTPQSQSIQRAFAPTPHFIIAASSQALTPRDNEPPSAIRNFAPTPRFFITNPIPAPPDENEPQFIKPPKFAHIEESEPTQPLPEEFSPRKRGQKLVVGGVAQEVRSWLVDLETQFGNQTSLRSGIGGLGREERRDEEWMVKMTVEDANAMGGGWTMAKGDGLNVILGGEGIREGLEREQAVQRGSVVGIKAPVWEVEVDGMRWSVGANWKVWES